MLASLLNLSVVLPQLNANGRQTGSDYAESQKRLVPFSEFYDVEAVSAALAPLVRIEPATAEGQSPRWASWRRLKTKQKHKPLNNWRSMVERSRWQGPLWLELEDCAMFSLDKRGDDSLRALFWRIDAVLAWSPRIIAAADAIVSRLRQHSLVTGGAGDFSALHMRIEEDWVEHCAMWEDVHAHPPRDNCMTNTDTLGNVFLIEAVPTALPVYVATEEQGGVELGRLRGLRTLPSRYKLLSKHELAPELATGTREFLAAVDFAVGERARIFIGNSVSTYSALMLMRRSEAGVSTGALCGHKYAADFHYNGGNVPLSDVLFDTPLCSQRPFKWVFTLNAHATNDPDAIYAQMARVAVLSARSRTRLVPVCVFEGAPNAMTEWMRGNGVRVIFHTPQWKERLMSAFDKAQRDHLDTLRTPLYKRRSALLSTHLRLDIPMLGFVDKYIFYADIDVFFLHDLTLDAFRPLPALYAVGPEAQGWETVVRVDESGRDGNSGRKYAAFGNAGVMLFNVASMRRTNGDFVKWVFSDENLARGLDHGNYGPADQGAYNEFYQGRFDVHAWPLWNWKPYWGHRIGALMVHFHGPKPSDYIAHMHNEGTSPLFQDLLARCDRLSESCYLYTQMFFTMLNSSLGQL